MRRIVRVAAGVALLGIGSVLALWGVFAILYQGDRESGATYVPIQGHAIDADLVGVVALLVALVALGAAAVLLTHRRFLRQLLLADCNFIERLAQQLPLILV